MARFVISPYIFQTRVKERVKFAFVSDLHDCENQPILQAIQENGADAILIGGDFIHSSTVYANGIQFLKEAAKLLPTFCVLGNHELRFGGDLIPIVRDIPITLLRDEDVEFKGVRIGGISSSTAYSEDKILLNHRYLQTYSKKDGFKLLLCHHPEYYGDHLRQYKIDLILSGHAHGGQWRLFGRGAYAPGQGVFPKYTSGLYEERLLVGRGLGNHHIVPRINNRRELIFITIEPFEN